MSTRKLLFGASCAIAQPLLLNLVSVPATAFIIRSLGPASYGQWAVGVSLILVMSLVTNCGLRTLFVRSLATDPELAAVAFAEQLGLRLALAFLGGALAVVLGTCLGYPPVVLQCTVLGALGLLLGVVSMVTTDLLQALQRLPALASINFTAGLLLTGASVLVVWRGGGPVELSLAYLVGPLVSATLFLAHVQRQHFPVRVRWDLNRFRDLLGQGRALTAQLMVQAIGNNIEGLLAPKLIGIAQYGFFTAGMMPAARLTIVPDGVGTAFYPIIARSHRNSPNASMRQVIRYMGVSIGLCVLISVSVTLLAGPVAHFLFPNDGALCRVIMQISIWALPVLALSDAMAYSLNAAGKHAEQARASISAIICGVVVCSLVIWRLGLMGACWTPIIRYSLLVVFLAPRFLHVFTPKSRLLQSELEGHTQCMNP